MSPLTFVSSGPVGALAITIACSIDRSLGEPPLAFHPVVWMGRALASVGAPWEKQPARRAFWLGAGAWLLLAAGGLALAAAWVGGAAMLADRLAAAVPLRAAAAVRTVVQGVLLGVALKPLLAWRLLRTEVMAVELALRDGAAGLGPPRGAGRARA